MLSVGSSGCGSVTTPGEGQFQYAAGSEVPLVATEGLPEGGRDCLFAGWSGPVVDSSSSSTSIFMTGNSSVVASFERGPQWSEDEEGCMDPNATNYDPYATIPCEPDCCEY